jgi:hypothetical protein
MIQVFERAKKFRASGRAATVIGLRDSSMHESNSGLHNKALVSDEIAWLHFEKVSL